eukprot:GEMP01027157.1.p1 GENE.GEMP01027157.1~~GEMP01027157.1.p1  ORF type:complete len:279 (+),score=52.24 GEMP01027157.1:117-953(+)
MSLRVLLPPPSPRSHLDGIRQKPLNPITEAIHEKQRRAKYGWELAPEGGHRPMELAPNLIYDDAARATYLTTLTHAMPPTPSTTTSQSSTAPCAPFELSIHPTAPPVPFPDELSAADVPLPAALPTVDTICAAIRTCLPSHIDHVALGRAVRTALLSVGIDSGEQNAYPQADAPFSTISCGGAWRRRRVAVWHASWCALETGCFRSGHRSPPRSVRFRVARLATSMQPTTGGRAAASFCIRRAGDNIDEAYDQGSAARVPRRPPVFAGFYAHDPCTTR